jgi:hypothetical protein
VTNQRHLSTRRVAAKPYEAAQALSEVAVEWWLAHRPLDYLEAEHFDNPTVNCVGEIERRLATAVADLLRTERDV